jgi:asparagine synthase (glutamine-hydrolysing)
VLLQHQQTHGTLIIRLSDAGRLTTTGPERLSLGYSVQAGSTLLERHDHHGRSSASEDGVWAQWTWDRHRLRVNNDRFGFLPIYFAKLPNGFGISTSIMDLLRAGANAQLNDAAIAVFLRLGYYIGNDTPFQNIHLLPPCSELTWDGSKVDLKQSAPPISGRQSSLSRHEAIQQYGERFQEAVEAMLPSVTERMCVPLSAGRDSRHILYALVRAG